MLCGCFPLAIYFTFGSVYVSMPLSHFVRDSYLKENWSTQGKGELSTRQVIKNTLKVTWILLVCNETQRSFVSNYIFSSNIIYGLPISYRIIAQLPSIKSSLFPITPWPAFLNSSSFHTSSGDTGLFTARQAYSVF